MPVLLGSLGGRKVRHHDDIQTCRFPVRVHTGNDILVDENLAVPALHGRDNVRQDLLAVLVGPVMQNRVHVVGTSSCIQISILFMQRRAKERKWTYP